MLGLDNYLEIITKRLAPYYDIYRDQTVMGEKLDLMARFKMRNEKYFLLKQIKLFAYENHEIVLVRGEEQVTADRVKQFCTYLKQAAGELVRPSDEHMSSVITGVLVATSGVTPEGQRIIEDFSYSKNFRLLLQGWCEVRLVAVDRTDHNVYTNKAGRALQEAYCIFQGKEAQGETYRASIGSTII